MLNPLNQFCLFVPSLFNMTKQHAYRKKSVSSFSLSMAVIISKKDYELGLFLNLTVDA